MNANQGEARSIKSSRGRPSREDAILLRERLLAAAFEEFRTNGYVGARIDGVARIAGVSRTTIYALYTDKATLFVEMLTNLVDVTDLGKLVTFDDRPAAMVLGEAFVRVNRFYFREPNLEIVRLCISEAEHFPELFEALRGRLVSALGELTAYFDRMQACGRMTEVNSETAAKIFNMLALGTLKPFMIGRNQLSAEERDVHLGFALRLFVRGAFNDPAAEGA